MNLALRRRLDRQTVKSINIIRTWVRSSVKLIEQGRRQRETSEKRRNEKGRQTEPGKIKMGDKTKLKNRWSRSYQYQIRQSVPILERRGMQFSWDKALRFNNTLVCAFYANITLPMFYHPILPMFYHPIL